MRKLLLPMIFAFLLVEILPAEGPVAQVNPLKRHDIEASDLKQLEAAAERLYRSSTVEPGTVERWSNSETGSSGTVELVERFATKGMPCSRLRHVMKLAGYADPYRLTMSRCQVADGEWKVLWE